LGKLHVVHPFPAKNHFVPPTFAVFGFFDGDLKTVEARLTGPDNRVIPGQPLPPAQTKNKIWVVRFDLTPFTYKKGDQFLLLVKSTDGQTQPVLLDGLVLRERRQERQPERRQALPAGPVIEYPEFGDTVPPTFVTYGWGTANLKSSQSVTLILPGPPPQTADQVDPTDPSRKDWLATLVDEQQGTYSLQVVDVQNHTATVDDVHVEPQPTFLRRRHAFPHPPCP
jgi:hypothetical protein